MKRSHSPKVEGGFPTITSQAQRDNSKCELKNKENRMKHPTSQQKGGKKERKKGGREKKPRNEKKKKTPMITKSRTYAYFRTMLTPMMSC